MILAQIPTATGNQILTVLIGGAALLAIALMIKALLPKRRHPPIESEFVSREEHDKDIATIAADVEKIVSKLEETKTELMLDGRRRSAALYQHIKEVNTEIFSRLNTNDKQIAHLEERTK